MAEAIEVLKKEGAVVVDPADIPSVVDPDPAKNFLKWGTCGGIDDRNGQDTECSIVLKYGMKRDFNLWLQTLGEGAPVKSLKDLIFFNTKHAPRNAIKFGQSRLDISEEIDLEADEARYVEDRKKDVCLGGEHGIDAVMDAHRLDAILFPGASGASIAAKPGYPTVIVPFALLPNAPTPPLPRDCDAKPAPFGVSFTGKACSEGRLIELAYAFEQTTKRRVPPAATP